VLSYPPEPADGEPRIKEEITWLKHLENWHFITQDVLLVFADKSHYISFSTAASILKDDTRELSYVLKHDSKFSGK
jgi:hypothetical protein